ncbi:hypothetical protein FRC06_003977 [Ceratobasidium sp. 370]|nr:hypothetical protein FRC06_003977 [Ceratobasidium sp. 370]
MPMKIEFDEKAIKFLVSPPKPSHSLRDILLNLEKSPEITSLARMGRDLIRSCASARMYTPPISEKFDFGIDNRVSDSKLASVAESIGLLERLTIDTVAIDPVRLSLILCAYLGAAFRCAWKEHGINAIHSSVNDICSLILNDDDPAVIENNSHERMMGIPGVEKMTTPAYTKTPPTLSVSSPTPTRGPQNLMVEMDVNSNESVSSGRSPPPHLYGPHYQQPFQPFYSSNLSNPPPPHPHPMQHMYLQSGLLPQRLASYVPGSAPTSSPAFVPTPPQSQVGSGGYQQPPYQQMQYASPSPQAAPTQPSNMAPGGWMPNPPGYAMPAPAPTPAQVPPSMPMPPPPGQQTQGFISLFNELAMKNRMQTSWQQQKTGQQHIPEWTMWLVVDGTLRGHGTAPTKQAAKEIAAKAALQAMGWLAA